MFLNKKKHFRRRDSRFLWLWRQKTIWQGTFYQNCFKVNRFQFFMELFDWRLNGMNEATTSQGGSPVQRAVHKIMPLRWAYNFFKDNVSFSINLIFRTTLLTTQGDEKRKFLPISRVEIILALTCHSGLEKWRRKSQAPRPYSPQNFGPWIGGSQRWVFRIFLQGKEANVTLMKLQ